MLSQINVIIGILPSIVSWFLWLYKCIARIEGIFEIEEQVCYKIKKLLAQIMHTKTNQPFIKYSKCCNSTTIRLAENACQAKNNSNLEMGV